MMDTKIQTITEYYVPERSKNNHMSAVMSAVITIVDCKLVNLKHWYKHFCGLCIEMSVRLYGLVC